METYLLDKILSSLVDRYKSFEGNVAFIFRVKQPPLF